MAAAFSRETGYDEVFRLAAEATAEKSGERTHDPEFRRILDEINRSVSEKTQKEEKERKINEIREKAKRYVERVLRLSRREKPMEYDVYFIKKQNELREEEGIEPIRSKPIPIRRPGNRRTRKKKSRIRNSRRSRRNISNRSRKRKNFRAHTNRTTRKRTNK
jgi:hypothetical protein